MRQVTSQHWQSGTLALGFCLLGLGLGAAPANGADDPSWSFSTSADDELLVLSSSGGLRGLRIQYRLQGDGRLAREIYYSGAPQAAFVDEAELSPIDIKLLMQLLVESKLPELTPESLRRSLGGPPVEVDDGAMVVLRVEFQSYQGAEQAEPAPLSATITMLSPESQASAYPNAPQPKALVALRTALDDYFDQSAAEVLYGPSAAEQ